MSSLNNDAHLAPITGSDRDDFIAFQVVGLARSFLENQQAPIGEIPRLFSTLKEEIEKLYAPTSAAPKAVALTPIQIKNSIAPDHLTSFEDGKQYKSLKRHLATRGMTPEQYRAKWGLPLTYPMVAASYAAKRSDLAKRIGLGRKKGE